MRNLTYKDIENLPADHPLVVQFLAMEQQFEKALAEQEAEYNALDDEQSIEHFDRYIAGDR